MNDGRLPRSLQLTMHCVARQGELDKLLSSQSLNSPNAITVALPVSWTNNRGNTKPILSSGAVDHWAGLARVTSEHLISLHKDSLQGILSSLFLFS